MNCYGCDKEAEFLIECFNCEQEFCLECVERLAFCPNAPGGHDFMQDVEEGEDG